METSFISTQFETSRFEDALNRKIYQNLRENANTEDRLNVNFDAMLGNSDLIDVDKLAQTYLQKATLKI